MADSLTAALEREHHQINEGIAVTRQLTSHLLHHNLKEEKVLYPLADETLPAAEAERLRTFIDAGELPDGWVCFKARP